MTKVQEFLKEAENLTEEMEGRMIARAFHSELDKLAAKNEDTGPGLGTALLAGGGTYGAYKGIRAVGRRARLLGIQQSRRHAGRQAMKQEVSRRISEKATGSEIGKRIAEERGRTSLQKTLTEGYRAQAPEAVSKAIKTVGRRAAMTARLRSAAKAYKPTPKVTPGLVSATRSVVHTGPGFGAARRRALIKKVLARR